MNLYKRVNTKHVCLAYIGGQVLLSLVELVYNFINKYLF